MLLKFLDFHIQYFRLSFYAQSLCAAEAGEADIVAIDRVLAVLSLPRKKVEAAPKRQRTSLGGANVEWKGCSGDLPLVSGSVPGESSTISAALKDVEELEDSFSAFKSMSIEFEARLKWKRKTG